MTADVLREAATLMRDRAQGLEVTGDWWEVNCLSWLTKTSGTPGLAEHIASWPPIVALAVALLLENESHAWDLQESRSDPDGFPDLSVNHARRSLLTDVARAYLGVTA